MYTLLSSEWLSVNFNRQQLINYKFLNKYTISLA